MSHVRYETRGPAAWILLDRPEKRNALSAAMIAQIAEALDRASADDAVRAVVVTGRGPAFCAGADLEAGVDLADAGAGPRNPFARLLQRFQTCAKPVIAVVNGPAFGGGLGLVAAADIVIASSDVVFSFSEVRLGLIPAMISVMVLPRIGPHNARRLFLTGRRFTAEEAVGYGLVHRVTSADDLEAAAEDEIAEIAKGGPIAVAEAKRLIREIPSLPENEAFHRAAAWLAELVGSEEAREGVAAFVEKRPPKWPQ
ncbi:MAG: enoyl-CoA hydratase [bacterium]|nr:enoyl-CoA hydratase [bacterium]